MTEIFITGMGRSGTTLLDKLLTNHQQIDVVSQPLPLIFVEAKKRFLNSRGIEKYFVLNDDLVNRSFTQDEFDGFLSEFTLGEDEIESIFETMSTYSGQYTKREVPGAHLVKPCKSFKDLLDRSMRFYNRSKHKAHHGIKETMCEEFMPYLCKKGHKCILIIRDPRDVLASVNYPRGERYFGDKKPTLFVLRSWRKSVEYAYLLRNNVNLHVLLYEDLVADPYRELDRITSFLGTSRYKANCFADGIFDRNGELWQANSSFENQGSFIFRRSKNAYESNLSDEEIAYTEAVCSMELNWLGYPSGENPDKLKIIKDFKDYGITDSRVLSADFSSETTNIANETKRLNELKCFFEGKTSLTDLVN